MATLQAARAQVLGLPLSSAKSWGLNRAIYYAAAKRGFKGGSGPAKPEKYQRSFGEYWLGLDKAYKVRAGGRMLFTIGGDIQHPEDFKRQIEERFQGTFRQAWKEAREILQRYKREALESPEHFISKCTVRVVMSSPRNGMSEQRVSLRPLPESHACTCD